MSSKNTEATTVNINLNGLNEARPGNPETNQHVFWPWPWPFPFPWPPFPFPEGPFGPGPILRTDGGSQMDEDQLFIRTAQIGLRLELKKGYKTDEIRETLAEKVLPELAEASSLEEIDSAMKSIYKAYPTLKDQLHELYDDFGGDGNPAPEKAAANPILWWLARKAVKVVVKVAVAATITALGAKEAK